MSFKDGMLKKNSELMGAKMPKQEARDFKPQRKITINKK